MRQHIVILPWRREFARVIIPVTNVVPADLEIGGNGKRTPVQVSIGSNRDVLIGRPVARIFVAARVVIINLGDRRESCIGATQLRHSVSTGFVLAPTVIEILRFNEERPSEELIRWDDA